MKLAPEHSETRVLQKMGKSGRETLLTFRELFLDLTKRGGKKLFLTYYLIAAHPGCTDDDMARLRSFALRDLQLLPEQVQVFTPTPSTWSTLMYWTERDPFTGKPCFVEKTYRGRERQKDILADRRTKKQQTDRSRTKNRGTHSPPNKGSQGVGHKGSSSRLTYDGRKKRGR